MKFKLLIIILLVITLTSCETKPIPIPFNVTKEYSAGRFDTILLIKGEDNTYYFSKDSLKFTHRIDNDSISTNEMQDGSLFGGFLLLLLLIFLLTIVFL